MRTRWCILLLAVGAALNQAQPAAALSCVPPPTGQQSTRALLASGDFQGRFDGAVVGLVTSQKNGGSGGRLVVRVEQSFGPLLHGEVTIENSMWNTVETGRRYVVPYVVERGSRTTKLCWDVPERVSGLLPSPTPSPARTAAAPVAVSHERGAGAWPWAAAAVLLVGSVTGVLLARRRSP